jgi:hypothetical protein
MDRVSNYGKPFTYQDDTDRIDTDIRTYMAQVGFEPSGTPLRSALVAYNLESIFVLV